LNRYTDSIDAQAPSTVVSPASTLNNRQNFKFAVRAKFNFAPQNRRELGFKKGDVLYVKRQIDANWFEGERHAAVGIFPVSYVEVLREDQVDKVNGVVKQQPVEQSKEGSAKAKFNFQAQTPMELSLVKGKQQANE